MTIVKKGFSLHQPYANLITLKHKLGETRHYSRSFRGDLLICSTLKPMTIHTLSELMSSDQFRKFNEIKNKLFYDIFGPLGVAQCVVTVTDWRPMNKVEDLETTYVNYHESRYVAVLENIRPIVTFKIKGRQGLFDLTPEEQSKINFGG